ncbi:hypothetical protein P7K49_027891 [Saguinus oedipus]|uniref:Ig-like domain-containing protein n=1 Tax=Saguinus oedipus TaxID=9490 RepID=A0ABQ9UAP3_SAGOE|nr:hypothetical protein P7K49_027891 [Saguinus oedipus]
MPCPSTEDPGDRDGRHVAGGGAEAHRLLMGVCPTAAGVPELCEVLRTMDEEMKSREAQGLKWLLGLSQSIWKLLTGSAWSLRCSAEGQGVEPPPASSVTWAELGGDAHTEVGVWL